ncbi:hypothetical protein MKW92_015283 [Papaver armeniacum]|nr:hypothetical protein MKW92_015283 [Papaver armeniacum]
MGIIWKRSPGFFTSSSVFAILTTCLIVIISTDMAAAWKRDMCIPGDVYIDSQNARPQGTNCTFCEDWCKEECSDLECSALLYPAVSYGCYLGGDIRCKCCCGKSPSSLPSSPTRTPLPDSEFSGPWPHDINICKPEERYIKIKHKNGRHCVKKPSCEESCNKEGLWSTRSECGAGGRAFPDPAYEWYEQCCCGKSKPSPPPSPSPPPPPPPSPPLPPKNICKAGDQYSQITYYNTNDCGLCKSDCQTQCSATSVTKQMCTTSPTSVSCKCCCKSSRGATTTSLSSLATE